MQDTVMLGGVSMTKSPARPHWTGNAKGCHFNVNQEGDGSWSLVVEDEDANILEQLAGLDEDTVTQRAGVLFQIHSV